LARTYDEQAASLHYSHDAMRGWQRCVKRVADFVCALLGILLLLPVFIAIAIVLKLQKNGPVIFSQERIGYQGRPFTIYKFRTLSTVVEDEGPQLIARSDSVKSTQFERWLREHHIDELPQLWNVLRGDMSLVGPRPERKYYINQIMEHNHDYVLIYQMRPGLTSEATIYNGYTDTMEKMLKRLDMDIRYLENRTLGLDLKIILSTIYGLLVKDGIK
jgi:lipopolysaccharide/colanic/teichoic acid biosynthesis glycosyltransferase